MNIMKNIGKTLLDLGETFVITGVIDTEFWQDLIISIVVILFNFLIIPLLKSLINKIKSKTGLDIPDIPDEITPNDLKVKDNEEKEEKK